MLTITLLEDRSHQSGLLGPGSSAGSGPVGAPIMILDELDSGVGSRLGQPVAAMLRRMTAPPSAPGASHGTATQILCVSHIPQVRDYSLRSIRHLR